MGNVHDRNHRAIEGARNILHLFHDGIAIEIKAKIVCQNQAEGFITDQFTTREHRIARLGIGRKFQSPRVFEKLSVQENLALAVSRPKQPLDLLFGRLTADQRDQVQHLMEIVNLQNRADWLAGSLSHGQKQWLEIAMLVGQDPDLLLVEEPVAGLTDEETDLTADLLKSLAGDHTVLVIEHDMEFIRRLNSTVTVLHQGHVLCEGSMDQIQQDPQVIEVYLGTQEEM